MGKTKIKAIDLSQPEDPSASSGQGKKDKKLKSAKSEYNEAVSEVEQVEVAGGAEKKTLEESVVRGDAEEGSRRLTRSDSEDGRRETEAAGPRTSAEQSKPQSKKVRSKKYQEAIKQVDPNQKYSLNEAVKLTQQTSYSKFPGTVEAHLNTNAKNLRGLVSLPFGAGKKLKVLAFGKGAQDSGADLVGADETISEIEKGKVDFDVVVTTPDWMPKLAKAAKVLGPKGLMPNPKNGTITDNLAKTVAEMQGGKTEYKTESTGQVIHLAVGKTTQPSEEISANLKVLYNTIGKSKIKKIILSSSMGPGVKVDLASI
ncbi:50S ribosomal protein L1 [Candidatus Daviesbacteria bacterium]|nr:50S ribosomal protein L1 [Candidatus Daviesbacteria bacterium]